MVAKDASETAHEEEAMKPVAVVKKNGPVWDIEVGGIPVCGSATKGMQAAIARSLNAALAPLFQSFGERVARAAIEEMAKELKKKAIEAKPFGEIAVVGFEAAVVVVKALSPSAIVKKEMEAV